MKMKISLKKATVEDFDAMYDELERSFISEERRDREDARRLINDGVYTVYHVLDSEARVGFVTVWELDGFAFVEHFVTYGRFRNMGYGSSALELLKARYDKIVLEAEPPNDNLTARRVAFYGRNGFCKNSQYYFQPSYRKGGDGVELVIMSYPRLLDDFDSAVSKIYKKVYGKL